MTALARRLAVVERATAARDVGPCRACGGAQPGRFVLAFEGDRPEGPERCPECGRRLVYRMEFDKQG